MMENKKKPVTGSFRKLGELLLESGIITKAELDEALLDQKRTKRKLGKILIDMGCTSEMEIVSCLAQSMKLEYVELYKYVIESEIIKLVPAKIVEKHLVMPVRLVDNRLTVAMSDPLDLGAISDLEFFTGKRIQPVVSTLSEIRKAILVYYYNAKPVRLGKILVDAGVLTEEQLAVCLEQQKSTKKKIGDVIVELAFASEIDIAKAISSQMNLPYLDLTFVASTPQALELLEREFALKHSLIPLNVTSRTIEIAMSNPMDIDAIREVKSVVNRDVDVVISTPTEVKNAIHRHYTELSLDSGKRVTQLETFDRLQELFEEEKGGLEGTVEIKQDRIDVFSQTPNKVLKESESPPVIKLVNKILFSAIKAGASDIHLEPRENQMIIRMRIDGIMTELTQLPKAMAPSVISRIKVMSKMDISERRLPQDSGMKIRVEDKKVDLRISTLPSQFGEKVVMRVLDPSSTKLTLADIGLSEKDYRLVMDMIEKPQGLVLVTGPTGSGKSSTLYAALNYLMDDKINMITLEDPVEYNMAGTTQVNINDKIGYTFAAALRSVLRQDPDIVMVGEMRDSETSSIAIQASITGHLVLSTLHTTTAVAAITRLKGMDIKTHFIASSLNGIIAQRLVRKLCGRCKEPYTPTPEELLLIGLNDVAGNTGISFYRHKGCEACGNRGYKGRVGIFEIMPANSIVKKLIYDDAGENVIVQAAKEFGMGILIEDGINKIMQGITTLSEVLRVTSSVSEGEIIICSRCKEPISSDYVFCPKCGDPLGHKCPQCNSQRSPGWKFCPYCNEEFHSPNDRAL
ncbi:MAG: Flp pilus assembly complex ATPase component TadA [Nitrospirae bacterium]|nr:Flp pilus assembly complex ATPase component TadA [Nitrospirota bacterium]